LHDTDPSLPSPRLKASLYYDCESSLPLKLNFVDDASSTGLEAAFDPLLTSLPFVAPSFSGTALDTTVNDLSLLVSPLPLVQCTGLEMGEPPKGYAGVVENDLLDCSKELTLVKSYLEETPFEEL